MLLKLSQLRLQGSISSWRVASGRVRNTGRSANTIVVNVVEETALVEILSLRAIYFKKYSNISSFICLHDRGEGGGREGVSRDSEGERNIL